MLSITITVTDDVITAQSSVAAAIVAQIAPGTSYTPAYGPSAQQSLAADTWIYWWTNGTDSDWAAASGVTTVPSCATLTSSTAQTIALPAAAVLVSGRVYFGTPDLPSIAVVSNVVQPLVAPMVPGIYDFVEFSYGANNQPGVIYVDTSMIDQFGLPLQIQISPVPSASPLPNGSGVFLDRSDVFSNFNTYAPGDFASCAQTLFQQAQSDPPLRLLSPTDVLTFNTVQGLVVLNGSGSSTLAAGTYAYAITALDANGNESYAQATQAMITLADANQPVLLNWAPLAAQPLQGAGIASYNVYRYTFATGAWAKIDNVAAITGGGSASDSGQAGTAATPPLNPLVTYFDTALGDFFAYYEQNTLDLLVVSGSPTANVSWNYSFSGTSTTDSVTGLPCLQFLFTGAVVTSTQDSVASSDLPFPANTPFNIYQPYWNTNTFDASNPAPPSWTPYPNSPASMMVFAANGVFADNLPQVYFNLPSGVTPPPPPPSNTNLPAPVATTPAGIWNTLLATLENMVVSAITRGIAVPVGGTLPIAPIAWAAQPSQTAPTVSSGTSSLAKDTYYYVVTTVLDGDESAASLELSAVVADKNAQVVNVNWNPLPKWQATSFNIYRGTSPGGENVLAGNQPNDGTVGTFADSGGGTDQTPPAYYESDEVSSSYDAFFHQPSVSIGGGAYASPFDDQGNQSSTLAGAATGLSITVGPWSS